MAQQLNSIFENRQTGSAKKRLHLAWGYTKAPSLFVDPLDS